MLTVKADAYGYGILEMSKAADAAQIDYLGVAMLDEAILLRKGGIKTPILILGCSMVEEAEDIVGYDLTQTVCTKEMASALSREAKRAGKQARIHIKVDTGMGRIGIFPEGAADFAGEISRLDDVEIEGIYTHFSSSFGKEPAFTTEQLNRFKRVLSQLREKGVNIPISHIANSLAILEYPQSHLDMVRAGFIVYGLGGLDDFKPVLSFKTRIVFVKRVPPQTPIGYERTYVTEKQTSIAVLPVGYADGLSRYLSNNGEVLVLGRRLPIVGRVCMDQVMVDAGDLDVKKGDEAVLIGRQGSDEITAEEVACRINTIERVVITGIGKRVPRVYK